MPTSYLSRDQRNRFGVFNGPVAPEDLATYFVLDKHELHIIQNLRGAHNRLGYATLLCSVRFIGTFPEAVDSIPTEVLPFIRDQLKVDDDIDLRNYFRSRTYERHIRSIRQEFGFVSYHDAEHERFKLARWLYAECWAGNKRPSTLVLFAADWLLANKVILPGVSVLERFVARIRERAQQRLWHRMLTG